MVWGWHCCGCKCVLLENTTRKLTLEEAKKEFPKFASKLDELSNPGVKRVKIRKTKTVRKKRPESWKRRKKPMKKVRGKTVSTPVTTTEEDLWYDAVVTDDEAESEYEDEYDFPPAVACLSVQCAKIKRISNRQLYEYKLTGDQITEEEIRTFISDDDAIMERLGIVARPCDKYGLSDDVDDDENLYTLSLPVNSYDAEAPEVDYPANFDLAHDGICIYILCEDENGKEFRSCYWGD
jgi:hypothetical protein